MRIPLWQTITDWEGDQKTLRRRPYGIIETSAGKLVAIHLRPWPKLLAWPEVLPVGPAYHARGQADRCCPNFLAVKYVVTTTATPYATFIAAFAALDAIAQLKQTDALLCDAFNGRLSNRLLKRHGWEPHKRQRWHRNFIKRFYGEYPGESPGVASPSRRALPRARSRTSAHEEPLISPVE